MKPTDLEAHFPLEIIDSVANVNPLAVAERMNRGGITNITALERVVEKKLPFDATSNALPGLFRDFIKVQCPYCKKAMSYCTNRMCGLSTVVYVCDHDKGCGANMELSLDPNEMHFAP